MEEPDTMLTLSIRCRSKQEQLWLCSTIPPPSIHYLQFRWKIDHGSIKQGYDFLTRNSSRNVFSLVGSPKCWLFIFIWERLTGTNLLTFYSTIILINVFVWVYPPLVDIWTKSVLEPINLFSPHQRNEHSHDYRRQVLLRFMQLTNIVNAT